MYLIFRLEKIQSEENRTLCMTVQEYITRLLTWRWKEMKPMMDGREGWLQASSIEFKL